MRAGFSGFGRVESRHLLGWRRRYHFTKSYLDAKNDPVIESYLCLEGITSRPSRPLCVFSATSLRFFSYLRMIDSSLVEKFASHSTHPETSLTTKQLASGQDLPDPFLTL